jgi:uncharacterized protein YneF (UPF0154 family)
MTTAIWIGLVILALLVGYVVGFVSGRFADTRYL